MMDPIKTRANDQVSYRNMYDVLALIVGLDESERFDNLISRISRRAQPDIEGLIVKLKGSPWTCSESELVEHVAYDHLDSPGNLKKYGLVSWDAGLAKAKGYRLDGAVKFGYAILEMADFEIQRNFIDPEKNRVGNMNPEEFKKLIVKNLMYMSDLGVADVDFSRVERAFPGARKIEIDTKRDIKDRLDPIRAAVMVLWYQKGQTTNKNPEKYEIGNGPHSNGIT